MMATICPVRYVPSASGEVTECTAVLLASIGTGPERPSEPETDSDRLAEFPVRSVRLPAVVSAIVPL